MLHVMLLYRAESSTGSTGHRQDQCSARTAARKNDLFHAHLYSRITRDLPDRCRLCTRMASAVPSGSYRFGSAKTRSRPMPRRSHAVYGSWSARAPASIGLNSGARSSASRLPTRNTTSEPALPITAERTGCGSWSVHWFARATCVANLPPVRGHQRHSLPRATSPTLTAAPAARSGLSGPAESGAVVSPSESGTVCHSPESTKTFRST
jgi:hypothetical protein